MRFVILPVAVVSNIRKHEIKKAYIYKLIRVGKAQEKKKGGGGICNKLNPIVSIVTNYILKFQK
jgi:hypothetical protein